MGVETCWIIDPEEKKAWTVTASDRPIPAADGIRRASGIEIPLEEVLPLPLDDDVATD